jgi:hypothetical protein
MKTKIVNVWIDSEAVYIETDKGEIFSEYFSDYPLLREASPSERANFEYDNIGIHWKELDEDLSFNGFINKSRNQDAELYRLFKKHPELNVSAVARKTGIPQSVMGSYLCGKKNPSPKRVNQIKNAVRQIGRELLEI